jgi:hypothetical protein
MPDLSPCAWLLSPVATGYVLKFEKEENEPKKKGLAKWTLQFDNAMFVFRLERLRAIPIEIKMIAATIMTATSTTYNGVGDGEDPFGVGDDEDTIGVGDGEDTIGVGDGEDTIGVDDGEDTIGVGEVVIAKVAVIVPVPLIVAVAEAELSLLNVIDPVLDDQKEKVYPVLGVAVM